LLNRSLADTRTLTRFAPKLDVGSKVQIYQWMGRLAAEGKAVISGKALFDWWRTNLGLSVSYSAILRYLGGRLRSFRKPVVEPNMDEYLAGTASRQGPEHLKEFGWNRFVARGRLPEWTSGLPSRSVVESKLSRKNIAFGC
jgi:hypothetical protein